MYGRVLVGTDGSATATPAVEAAARLARAHDTELVVGHPFPTRLTPTQYHAWHGAPEELLWRLSSGSIAEDTVQAAVRCAETVAGPAARMRGRCEPGHPVPATHALHGRTPVHSGAERHDRSRSKGRPKRRRSSSPGSVPMPSSPGGDGFASRTGDREDRS